MTGIQNEKYDAPTYRPPQVKLEDIRQHFYMLLRQISPAFDLNHMHSYFIRGFSESKDIYSELSESNYSSTYDFLIGLYKIQLIHPRNVDFILSYASNINNNAIMRLIYEYHGQVGGKKSLLIEAKFAISTDKHETHIQPYLPPAPPFPAIQEKIRPQYHPPPGAQAYLNNYASSNSHRESPSGIQPHSIAPISANPSSPPPVSKRHGHGMLLYRIQPKTPRGLCFIINNEHFHSSTLPPRNGSTEDRKMLENTFNQLRYETHVYEDLSSFKMLECFYKVAKLDHSEYDSFVCCLLSHGKEDTIYGADSVAINQRDIFDLFQASKCPSLSGKPKMFFIQACRGIDMDSGTKGGLIDGDSDYDDPMQNSEMHAFTDLPTNSDFLIAYGTVYGYVSWRSPEKGTWYIEILCQLLRKYQNDQDIMSILTLVNNDLAQKKTVRGLKQIAAPVTMLRGQFYFNAPPNPLHFEFL